MLELLTDLMGDAVGRCAYAEARHVDSRSEAIAVLNGRVDAIDSSGSEGIGVRVQVGGGWGFAATREVTQAKALITDLYRLVDVLNVDIDFREQEA